MPRRRHAFLSNPRLILNSLLQQLQGGDRKLHHILLAVTMARLNLGRHRTIRSIDSQGHIAPGIPNISVSLIIISLHKQFERERKSELTVSGFASCHRSVPPSRSRRQCTCCRGSRARCSPASLRSRGSGRGSSRCLLRSSPRRRCETRGYTAIGRI